MPALTSVQPAAIRALDPYTFQKHAQAKPATQPGPRLSPSIADEMAQFPEEIHGFQM